MTASTAVRFSLLITFCLLAPFSCLRAGDVLTVADRLAHENLVYVYGSDDLSNGGLDCSGFTQTVFREACGIELPDQADKQLDYCRAHGQVWDSQSGWSPETLQPGDLVFYAGPRDLPRESRISHVMIYCGNGVVVGAQGKGRRLDGGRAGIGYYAFGTHHPSGVFGESGERFIGHLKVFAYARLNVTPLSGPASLMVSRPTPHFDPSAEATLEEIRRKLHIDPTALSPIFD